MGRNEVILHVSLTGVGLVLLAVLVLSLRAELTSLSENKHHRTQVILSVISMGALIYLTLTLLFNWSLSKETVLWTILVVMPVLLILAPIILILRARSFRGLVRKRIDEQRKLIREVEELMDERKRERIREGKISRGEPVDD